MLESHTHVFAYNCSKFNIEREGGREWEREGEWEGEGEGEGEAIASYNNQNNTISNFPPGLVSFYLYFIN